MIVNSSNLLQKARECQYAIGAFNVYNYETIRGVINGAIEMKRPMIVAFGECYLANMQIEEVVALTYAMAQKVEVPIVLHLDHCKSFETIVKAIRAGFTSVMYDGSALPLEENIRRTAEVVAVAHAVGVSVEAELGGLAKGQFSNEEAAEEVYTDPMQAQQFVNQTGIDALAVSIGTVHGMYQGSPRIDLDVLKKIAAGVDIPLVLHGGSGTPEVIIHECIRNGIAKINVNTEISVHTVESIKRLFNEKEYYHLSQISLQEIDFVKEVVIKYAKSFG